MKQLILDYECKYCHQHFMTTRGGLSNHMRFCKENPAYDKNIKTIKLQGERLHNKYENSKKEYVFYCKCCNKKYSLLLSDVQYNSGKYTKYCSTKCSHTRIVNNETRKKIGNSIIKSEKYQEHLLKIKEKKLEEYKNIVKETGEKNIRIEKYVCGSDLLDKQYPEISRHRQLCWFKNLIPFGFDYSYVCTEKIIDEYNKVKSLLYDEYVNNSLSPKDIWLKYNCKEYINNSETILHILKGMNIKTRGFGDAIINAHLQGKLINGKDSKHFKQKWYTTWEGKQVYLHSSYEEDYAKELDRNKIKYDVEFSRIKYWDKVQKRYRCAIPDFYLIDTNTIVEIKSLYTLDVKNLKDKFEEYKKLGYNTKLIVEHIEVDLNNFKEDKKYKLVNGEFIIKDNTYTSRNIKYHWISNLLLRQSMKCNEEDIDTFLKDGWIIGRKFNVN